MVGPLAWEDDPVPSSPSRGRPLGLPLLSHEGVSTPPRSLLDFEVPQGSLRLPICTSRRPLEGQRGGGEGRNFRGDEEGKAAAPVPEVGKGGQE